MMRPVAVFEPPTLKGIRPLAAIRRLGEFRDLFVTLSIHRIKVRYAHSHLGVLWAVAQPLAMMVAFTVMFTFLRADPSGTIPFPLFAYSALVPWTMFSSGLTGASTALTGHASLLGKVSFPREILPLTYVVAAAVDVAIASTVLMGLLVFYRVPLTMHALWSVPAIGTLAMFLTGLGLILSALQVRYRDVGLALPVAVQIWLFASPVLYPLEAVQKALPAPMYALYTLNPMAGVVDTFRRAVLLHQSPDTQALGRAILVSALLVPAGYVYFKYVELTMADVV